jgi:hypothetical protein
MRLRRPSEVLQKNRDGNVTGVYASQLIIKAICRTQRIHSVPQATRVYDAWVRLSHAKQQATEKMQYTAYLLPRDVVEIKTLKKTNYTEAYPSYDKLEESQASSCKYDSKIYSSAF